MPEFMQVLLFDPRGEAPDALRRRALRHRARRIVVACAYERTDDIGLETRRPDGRDARTVLSSLGAGANLILIDREAQDGLAAAARENGLPCTRLLG